MIRILVADDHPIVREGIASILAAERGMEVVALAAGGREAVTLALNHRPDVILMDLRMPDMDGVPAIREIRRSWPSARVIVLTTYDTDQDIRLAVDAGIRAYLLKDTPRAEIARVIRLVHEGGRHLPSVVAARLAEHLASEKLSARETEVLEHLSRGRSNKEIGAALGITEGTAKTHVSNILAKLGAVDRAQAVAEAVRRGIVRL